MSRRLIQPTYCLVPQFVIKEMQGALCDQYWGSASDVVGEVPLGQVWSQILFYLVKMMVGDVAAQKSCIDRHQIPPIFDVRFKL